MGNLLSVTVSPLPENTASPEKKLCPILPVEMLDLIIEHLNNRSLKNFRLTCKRNNRPISHEAYLYRRYNKMDLHHLFKLGSVEGVDYKIRGWNMDRLILRKSLVPGANYFYGDKSYFNIIMGDSADGPISKNHMDLIKYLVKNNYPKEDLRPVVDAVKRKDKNLVTYFFENGFAKNPIEYHPLIMCELNSDIEFFKFLLEQGCDPNIARPFYFGVVNDIGIDNIDPFYTNALREIDLAIAAGE